MPSAHLLDSNKRNFLHSALFDFLKFDQTRLFVFPFDSDKKTTFTTKGRIFKCAKTQDGALLIQTEPPPPNNMQFKLQGPHKTSDGYISWNETSVTLCQVDETSKIEFENGFMLDQSKVPFLPNTLIQDAYNKCFYTDCHQKDTAHFHDKFPSLLILPFDNDSKAHFINNQNQTIRFQIAYPSSAPENKNLKPITEQPKINLTANNVQKSVNNKNHLDDKQKTTSQTVTQTDNDTKIKKPKNPTSQSSFNKIFLYSCIGLFLIAFTITSLNFYKHR